MKTHLKPGVLSPGSPTVAAQRQTHTVLCSLLSVGITTTSVMLRPCTQVAVAIEKSFQLRFALHTPAILKPSVLEGMGGISATHQLCSL